MRPYASSHASPRLVSEGFYTRSRGVTLIDTIVGIALMLVVFMGIAATFRLSIDVVTNNKARSGAIALADQRMEYIRSLSYASIGTGVAERLPLDRLLGGQTDVEVEAVQRSYRESVLFENITVATLRSCACTR